ncbi:MAG: SDR family oxidoreductase [Saprospiraceae bacterium]
MDISLINKNALICGGSKGIGRSSALLLSRMGANITIVSRTVENMKKVVSELDTTQNQTHDYISVDFSNPNDVKDKIEHLVSKKNIHILINNTGGPPGGPILKAKPEAFIMAYNQHLICNHIITTSVVDGMEKEGYGRIINIISTSVKSPIMGLGVSNTTRGAVASWAKTMSYELGPKAITINNVLPGFTGTGRLDQIITNRATKGGITEEEVIKNMKAGVPMNRFADPIEVANAIGFLASPAASYITGISLPVDGGRTKCL